MPFSFTSCQRWYFTNSWMELWRIYNILTVLCAKINSIIFTEMLYSEALTIRPPTNSHLCLNTLPKHTYKLKMSSRIFTEMLYSEDLNIRLRANSHLCLNALPKQTYKLKSRNKFIDSCLKGVKCLFKTWFER